MSSWEVAGAVLALLVLVTAADRVRDLVSGTRHRSTVARLLLAAVRAYQRWISPVRPATCRFSPTCSAYAVTAVERFGAARGGWLATRRLLRCGPWHPGGHDPVPPAVADEGHRPRPDAPASSPTGAPRC